MPKRPLSEVSRGASKAEERDDTARSTASKRTKQAPPQDSSNALATLRDNSDELLEYLSSLKNSSDASVVSAAAQRFATLSKTLLPVFHTLSESESDQGAVLDGGRDVPGQALAAPGTIVPALRHGRGPIPALGSLTAWDPAEIPQSLPPLPPILDPALETAALTHSGMVKNIQETCYENLEFLGDAFIYHVASEYISQTFPHLQPGGCTHLRERLLRNSNLSQYTVHYGLDKRAKFPPEYYQEGRLGGSRASEKERQKVLGDIFEAYVGALIRADLQGVSRALNWLKPLWSMTIAAEIRDADRKRRSSGMIVPGQSKAGQPDASQPEQPSIPPKVQLAKLIGCKGVVIRYEDVPGRPKKDKHHHLPLFTIDVYVDAWGTTEKLASGSALSKKEAGSKAAQKALENKKALKFYTAKKKAYEAAQAAQEEAVV